MIWTVKLTQHAATDLGIVNEHSRIAAQTAAEAMPQWRRTVDELTSKVTLRTQPLYIKPGETS
jgi:hypothetical protein